MLDYYVYVPLPQFPAFKATPPTPAGLSMQYFAGRWTFASIALLVLTTSGLTQTCTVSLPTIAFGNVNVLSGAAVDTTATVTVSCINGQAVGQRVCISIGAGSDSDVTSRKMDDASVDKVRYDLFKD